MCSSSESSDGARTSVSILGAGAWGAGLAWLAAEAGAVPLLWGRSREQMDAMRESRVNEAYLPGVRLPESVGLTHLLDEAVSGASLVTLAVPVSALRSTLELLRGRLAPGAGLVIACKGLERPTGLRPSQVVAGVLGSSDRVVVLSGPNLAAEITRGLPAAAVAAGPADLVQRVTDVFGAPRFRIYGSTDITGVELGGALKNPMAIAAGASDGLGYGVNTSAGLITRALAEMTRVSVACGARAGTIAGIAGLGDLIATCHSTESRNYRFGRALGEGRSVDEALKLVRQVVEGYPTTAAAVALADEHGLDTPILRELEQMLYRGKPAREACAALLSRPMRHELEAG